MEEKKPYQKPKLKSVESWEAHERSHLFGVFLDGQFLEGVMEVGPLRVLVDPCEPSVVDITVVATEENWAMAKRCREEDARGLEYKGAELHVLNYDGEAKSVSWVDLEDARLKEVFEGKRNASDLPTLATIVLRFQYAKATRHARPYHYDQEGQEKTECPQCGFIAHGEDAIREFFGFRTMGDGRFVPQSWCRKCRIKAIKAGGMKEKDYYGSTPGRKK